MANLTPLLRRSPRGTCVGRAENLHNVAAFSTLAHMKLLIIPLTIAAVSCILMAVQAADQPKPEGSSNLRHMVAFKFKSTTTEQEIKQVENAFRDLKKKIPQVVSYEWGINISPEGFNKGCTHGFILTFKTEKDRDTYLNHPDHKAFGAMVRPLQDDVFVVDFWSRE